MTADHIATVREELAEIAAIVRAEGRWPAAARLASNRALAHLDALAAELEQAEREQGRLQREQVEYQKRTWAAEARVEQLEAARDAALRTLSPLPNDPGRARDAYLILRDIPAPTGGEKPKPENSSLVCDVCGKSPWWDLSREGDSCPDDEGHLVPTSGGKSPVEQHMAEIEERIARGEE